MKKALVVGKGKSGESAKELLECVGYDVLIKNTEELATKDRHGLSFVCLSPGIDINKFKKEFIEDKNINLQGELELGFDYLACKCVAITGTNGKTTTTSLIGEICKKEYNTFVGGNIGIPITSFCKKTTNKDLCVLEVSSFQAESFSHFRPYIGVFLNFKEDHLNRHGTLENYKEAKLKMFAAQSKQDFAVFNYDDKALREESCKIKSEVYFFSTKRCVRGCYLKSEYIYFNNGESKTKLFRMPPEVLGEHNKQNVLAAVLVAKLLNISDSKIFESISNFKLSKHRLEEVATIKGVKFINDSKSTNLASTEAALKCYKQKISLILGGCDKGYSFKPLFESLPSNVKNIAVIGDVAEQIVREADNVGYSNIIKAVSLEDAVRKLYEKTSRGGIVLLSPACASFDMFSNYKERGEKFKCIVEAIKNENCTNAGAQKSKV